MGSKLSGSGQRQPRPQGMQQPARLGTTMRWLTWGLTFTFVTSISAGIGATIALVTPLRFIPGLSNDAAAPINLFSSGLQYGLSRPVNVLVMGVDVNIGDEEEDGSLDPFKSRTDTMLLARVDPKAKCVSLLSIPRDTRVRIPDVGVDKINAANYYGGAELASEVVSDILNEVPIDRHVRVSTGAFRELVDVVGGVEVFVPHLSLIHI